MEPSPTSSPSSSSLPRRADRDFAPDPFPLSHFPPGFAPKDHQRLVVNPFLAVVAVVAWAWLTRRMFLTSFPPSSLLPSLILGGLPVLIHFHCLDCGATGIYPRWSRHACPRVVLRSRNHRPGWFPWPTARTQLIVWGYVLGSVALLLAVVGAGVALLTRE